MKRVPGTHWICNVYRDDEMYKEYELEYSLGVDDGEEDIEKWRNKWEEEYKKHKQFVDKEFRKIGIEVEEDERVNEKQYPYVVDTENGGQDVYLTARVLCEVMRDEEEEQAAIRIQRWFRGQKLKKENEEEKYRIIMDAMEIFNGTVVLIILMNRNSDAPYIIMLEGEDERGMKKGLKEIFKIEGKPEEITITKTQALLDEREYWCEENDIPYKSKQLIDIKGMYNTEGIRKRIEEIAEEIEGKEKVLDKAVNLLTEQMFKLLNEEVKEQEEEDKMVEEPITDKDDEMSELMECMK